jgi:tetratricopeptide (TPR) repeat protein
VLAGILARDLGVAQRWLERFGERNAGGARDLDLHYLQGRVRLQLEGRPDLALESFERMAAIDPKSRADERDRLALRAVSEQARRLSEAENYMALADLYRRAVAIARRRGDARMEAVASTNLALALQLDDRFTEAVEIFEGLRKKEPENPYWPWRWGENLAHQTKWAEAIPLYEETIRLLEAGKGDAAQIPEMNRVHLRLANCRRILAGAEPSPEKRADLLEKARRGFVRYGEIAPRDPRGLHWMGVLLQEELGKPYDAIPFFQRAYALDPVCDAALRHLVQIHRRNPPPPDVSQETWDERAAAYEKDLEEHGEARAAARRARLRGPAKDDGCD